MINMDALPSKQKEKWPRTGSMEMRRGPYRSRTDSSPNKRQLSRHCVEPLTVAQQAVHSARGPVAPITSATCAARGISQAEMTKDSLQKLFSCFWSSCEPSDVISQGAFQMDLYTIRCHRWHPVSSIGVRVVPYLPDFLPTIVLAVLGWSCTCRASLEWSCLAEGSLSPWPWRPWTCTPWSRLTGLQQRKLECTSF